LTALVILAPTSRRPSSTPVDVARVENPNLNNVAYNNVGHCYFLEDGVEHGNQYISNLGMLTKCHPTRPCNPTNALNGSGAGQNATDQLIPSDNTASTFWINEVSPEAITLRATCT